MALEPGLLIKDAGLVHVARRTVTCCMDLKNIKKVFMEICKWRSTFRIIG